MENKNAVQVCPLCGKGKYMGARSKSLYGQPVCRKCYDGFANRRQAAFLADAVLWYGVIATVGFIVGRSLPEGSETMLALGFWLVFLFKDGFAGYSPGKAIMGIQVVSKSGQPAGFGASFKRNLPLVIPLMPLFVAFSLREGYRVGDGWANTKVVWKKYRDQAPFAMNSVSQA